MNWLSYQELDIVRDLIARLPSGSLEARKNQKGKLKMLGLYYINEGYTYTFRANVCGITNRALTLCDLEILTDGKFVPINKAYEAVYYLCINDLCANVVVGADIEFNAEIGEMELNYYDVLTDYDNIDEDEANNLLSEFSVIENILSIVRDMYTGCYYIGSELELHRLLFDVYKYNVVRVLANPSKVKVIEYPLAILGVA